jgi:hypothetical protein
LDGNPTTPIDCLDTLAPPPAKPGETTDSVSGLGRYEPIRELGRGGMGVVYLARQTALKRSVALKMLSGPLAGEEAIARFRHEAEAVARLQHPNIVGIYEIGEQDGAPFLALEYIEGGSLADRLDGTPWAGQPAARFVAILARAVHHAHERGIVHRDLKPANILLSFPTRTTPLLDAVPKVSDFGLAKRLDAASGLSRTGDILGTPNYMAPEQAEGRTKAIGPASDVYALGALLYELITGRPPHRADSVIETVRQVVHEEPLAPRLLNHRIDRDLETICLRCLHKMPERRYESAAALTDDLDRYLRGEPILARPVSRTERAWRWCRRNPSRAALSAVIGLCAIMLLVFAVLFHRRIKEQLRVTEMAHESMQLQLTGQAAERLDAELRRLAAVADVAATTLSHHEMPEKQIQAWLTSVLDVTPRVFGMGVAFEPFAFDPSRRDYAFDLYRVDGQTRMKHILPPDYTPHYREWDWYTNAKTAGKGVWSEPYFDAGGGEVPMLTYSTPIVRKGKFVGVVTLDLSIDSFQILRRWLDDLRLTRDGYAYVISHTGRVISHPTCTIKDRITDLPSVHDDRHLDSIVRRMLDGESGRADAHDPYHNRPATLLFAPVPSAGWSLGVIVPRE